jgi:hypothetical protein
MKYALTLIALVIAGVGFCCISWLGDAAVSYTPSQPRVCNSVMESRHAGVFIQEFRPEHRLIEIVNSTNIISEVWLENEWVYADNGLGNELSGEHPVNEHPIKKLLSRSLLVTLKGHQLPESYQQEWAIAGGGISGQTIQIWLNEKDAVPSKLYIRKYPSPYNSSEAITVDSIQLHKVN